MRRVDLIRILFSAIFVLSVTAPAFAQTSSTSDLGGCKASQIYSGEQTTKKDDTEGQPGKVTDLVRSVRIDCDDMQFYAERAQVYHERHLVFAAENVLFVSPNSRISADRMEFDTQSRTGVFYNASGMASLGDRVDRSLFGTQEPDAYFWGRELRKVGPKKYEIVDGNFTTCVQPTPRWDISSRNVTVNLDDYALLVNAVLRVKGVPIMYLPVFYYPIQEDDRATGFLIPTYGTSTVKGQSISNAFFWAIGRSHDATIKHDWFSRTGQGVNGEYRYELGGGSRGDANVYWLDEHEATYRDSTGADITTPAKRSYQVRGRLTQGLGGGFRARANVDYFSDIVTQQRYQQDVYQATNRTRRFAGNVTGNWREFVISGTLDKNDLFYGVDTLTTSGTLPRISFDRGERQMGRTPLYFGVDGEYVTLLRSTTRDDVEVADRGLTRFDVNPSLRIPFTRWPFLTVNSAVSWRATYWTESKDATGVQVPDPVDRTFFDFQSRITGPVFNRIFDTPGSSYATRWKHVIEPTVTVQRVTAIDNFDRIVQLEGSDYTVGNVTRFSYGLNNRVYAKKDVAREILSVSLTQSYYTDALAAQYDQQYQSSFSGIRRSKFSPVRLQVRSSPTNRIQAEFSTEWDPTVHALRTFGAAGTINRDRLQVSAGWSQRRYLPDLPGFDDPDQADHYLNASTTVRDARNRLGATYTFNYDLRRDTFLQQRYLAFYNAQCCGVAVEYQTFNFRSGFAGLPITQDRRFNLSFTLAGIGTFSNFFGAFGGQDR